MRYVVTTLLAMVFIMTLSVCAGQAAREASTLPAMRTAWNAIKVEARREATARNSADGFLAIDQADAAMASGVVRDILVVPWKTIEDLAEADIARRLAINELGEGSAGSLREELRLFKISRDTYTRAQ